MANGTTKIAVGILWVFPIFIIVLGVIGWVMNLVKIIGALGNNDLTTMFVARIVGAFLAPIGAVLGFF